MLGAFFCDSTINFVHEVLHCEDRDRRRGVGRQLVVIFPSGRKISVPLSDIVKGGGSAYRFFNSSLRWLENVGVLCSVIKESSKIVVRLCSGYEALFELLDKFYGLDIGVFTETHYRVLMFIDAFSFLLDAKSIPFFFGLSRRGTEKIIGKLRKMGLITEEFLLTEFGKKLLSLCGRQRPRFDDIVRVEIVPLGVCTLLEVEGVEKLHEIARHVSDMLEYVFLREDLRNILQGRRICILGLDHNRHLVSVVEAVSSKLSEHFSVIGVPFIFSRTKFYDKIIIQSHNIGSDLFNKITSRFMYNQDEMLGAPIPNEIKKFIRLIIRNLQEDYVVVLLAPHIFCLTLNHLIAMEYMKTRKSGKPVLDMLRRGLSLIEITRLSDGMLKLRNDFEIIMKNGARLSQSLMDALKSGKKITITWNVSTEYPSWIDIIPTPTANLRNVMVTLVMKDYSLNRFTLNLPLGRVQLFNLSYLVKRGLIKVHGKIYLLGEPMYGLKCRLPAWPVECKTKPEAEIMIESKNEGISILVERTEYDYLKYVLDKATIFSIGMGLNQYLKKPRKIDLIIASKTMHFIDIVLKRPGIIDPSKNVLSHLLVANVEIYIEDERVWRTEPIPTGTT